MAVSSEIEGCQYLLEVRKEREKKRKATVEAGNKDPIKVLYCTQHLSVIVLGINGKAVRVFG